MVRISLHRRSIHNDATVVYNNPHIFDRTQRAWAVWVPAAQSLSSILDGTWGYDRLKGTTSQKIRNKRDHFTLELSICLQNVQIEYTEALRIINSQDNENAFIYCDPPYFNSDCGHNNWYSEEDFKDRSSILSGIKGKFYWAAIQAMCWTNLQRPITGQGLK